MEARGLNAQRREDRMQIEPMHSDATERNMATANCGRNRQKSLEKRVFDS